MELSVGATLAHRFRLRGLLGRGGAARTYLADDLLDGDQVALKLLGASRPHDELRREFERLRGVVHPHLLRVRDFALVQSGSSSRALYTAELVPGGDLRAAAASRSAGELRRLCGDVLEALHVLHALGLRHGDVKPENVLVDDSGRGVLIDLGCAAPLGHAVHALYGTPGYLAPELREGLAADERADLYAFGVMLRELQLPSELAPLIARLTAPQPAERPSSAREVLALLDDARDVDLRLLGRASGCLGRSRELDEMSQLLTQVERGDRAPRCIWIEGPPGIGRSRLLRELCYGLSLRGFDVLEARSREVAPVRGALTRLRAPFEPGFEALFEQLGELACARQALVCALDDAEQLGPEAREELAFAIRALPEQGRVAFVVTSTEPPPAGLPVHLLRLSPLDERALRTWAQGVLAPHEVEPLARYTGGYPRYVERALSAIVAGQLRAADLAGASGAQLDDESARALSIALAGLSRAEHCALAQIAIAGPVPRGELALEGLAARDLVSERGGWVQLARSADREPLLALLDRELVRAQHEESARRYEREQTSEARARAIEHYLRAGLTQQGNALLRGSRALALLAPRAFVQRLGAIAERLSVRGLVQLAELERLAGEAPRALALLSRARRELDDASLALEAAEVYLALGRVARARRMLERARASASDLLVLAELDARLRVREGEYQAAHALAEEALARCERERTDAALRAKLLETSALALGYLGKSELARAALGSARSLLASDDLRAQARNYALCGFVSLREGAAAEAIEAYGHALSLAERAGLADLVLNALANLASARQSLGLWGTALLTYERALRLGRALGRKASVRTVLLNIANLTLEIGSFARARSELSAIEGGESAALGLSLRLYRAELTLLEGDPRRALEELAGCALDAHAPERERVEWRALALHAATDAGDEARMGELLASLAEERDDLAPDLRARRADAEALALTRMGRMREAVSRVETAYAALRNSADQALLARLEGALATLYRALGAGALATEHGRRARARWERMALDLPPTLREVFWAHPRRRGLAREASGSEAPSRATLSLSRVRELNRRISALHTPEEVLEYALDAAIELTGAERGFVLLARERGFSIAAAHEMDRARAPKSEWKWSRSIAERVIRDGQPVLTVDAGRDPRFSRQASVHAMQLKSVLCAPIRAKSGVIGALYLDNRLARARFAEEDAELLLTFADQVAIALRHAELVRELEQRARELEREKRKVEELARGQAREIERLAEELESERAALGARYDYTDIVGRSEPMKRVLALLDRVIDSDLTVLVQGESGTGKELVARAIHMNGPRKERPFVSVNCAALPEQLLESELFGHVKGAFTGAISAREGLFVRARGGTLFLDELGELPLAMQAKLLRALNDGEVRPVGASKSFAVDVRLVCATNRKLKQRVSEGQFREDLYYRVSVVELTLPPLRERHEDIVPIAEALLARRARELDTPKLSLTPDAIRALLAHPWPGNVRELHNTLLRASVMAMGGVIRAADLELSSQPTLRTSGGTPTTRDEYARKEAERLLSALESARWNVSKVAKNLGIPRNTLYRKLARYGIQRDQP